MTSPPFAALLVLTSIVAFSAGAQEPVKQPDLPGVTPPEPIVKPLRSKAGRDEKDPDGWVRVGDWDVRISGSVRIDVGNGPRSRGH